jgi:protein SCO1/2
LALAFFAVSVVLPVAAAVRRVSEWFRPPLPIFGRVPEFSLLDQDREPLAAASLRGRPWVVNFIFTRCRGVCPALTEQMRRFEERCPEARSARVVSISVDPTHDTPEVLRAYAEQRGAVKENWSFVTGDRATVYELVTKGFRLAVQDVGGSPEEPIVHSEKFVLVDADLQIRGYYAGLDSQALDRLCGDLRRLARD